MAQRNYFLRKLSSYVSSAPKTYVNSVADFSGGLNTSKSAHLIAKNQTSLMSNLMFKNGGLYPRPSQKLGKGGVGEITACYEKPYYSSLGNPHMIYAANGSLYSLELEHFSDIRKDEDVELAEDDENQPVYKGDIEYNPKEIEIEGTYTIPTGKGGVFFEFGGALYYKARGCYIKIKENEPTYKYDLWDIIEGAYGGEPSSQHIRNVQKGTKHTEDTESKANAFIVYAAMKKGAAFIKTLDSSENKYLITEPRYYYAAGKVGHGTTYSPSAVCGNTTTYYCNVPLFVNTLDAVADFIKTYICAKKKENSDEDLYTAAQKALISAKCEQFKEDVRELYYPDKVNGAYPSWFTDLTTDSEGKKLDYFTMPNSIEINEDAEEDVQKIQKQKAAYVNKLGNLYPNALENRLTGMKVYVDSLLKKIGDVGSSDTLSKGDFKAISLSKGNNFEDIYIPTVGIGVQPNGTGATLIQAENRLTPLMRFEYCGDGTTKVFSVPIEGYVIDEAYTVTVQIGDNKNYGYSNASGSTITFASAPAKGTNNVVITMALKPDTSTKKNTYSSKTEKELKKIIESVEERQKAYDAFMDCDIATVYGGGYEDTIVVFAGSLSQPNAYFWSGIGEVADASYIPFDYYNLTGKSDAITGFGVQQAFLAIFSERAVGKANLTLEDAGDISLISLDYKSISTSIGCDVKNSIQLVENCLIFANTYGGVYRLSQTSDYNENCVERLSENINAESENFEGLLGYLRRAEAVCSYDDGKRYVLFASSHGEDGFSKAFVWDYSIYYYYGGGIAWFLWDGLKFSGTCRYKNTLYAVGKAGDFEDDAVIIFSEEDKTYTDFESAPVEYVYVIPPSVMGSYANEKEVAKAVFTVDRDVPTDTSITYLTDFERRRDLTDIIVKAKESNPFSMVFVRRPRSLRVHHLSLRLECKEAGKGFSLLTAQLFFKYMQEEKTYLDR